MIGAHVLHRRVERFGFVRLQGGRRATGEGGDDAVGDSPGQATRPGADRLRRYADFLGGTLAGPFSLAAEQADGIGLEHARLKHACNTEGKDTFPTRATCNVSAANNGCMGEKGTFGQRLAVALADKDASRADLARVLMSPKGELGISVAAVGQAINGPGSFNAENTLRAAAYLGVSAWWLATGEGDKAVGAAPVLHPDDREVLDDMHELLDDEAAEWRAGLHEKAEYIRRVRGRGAKVVPMTPRIPPLGVHVVSKTPAPTTLPVGDPSLASQPASEEVEWGGKLRRKAGTKDQPYQGPERRVGTADPGFRGPDRRRRT